MVAYSTENKVAIYVFIFDTEPTIPRPSSLIFINPVRLLSPTYPPNI